MIKALLVYDYLRKEEKMLVDAAKALGVSPILFNVNLEALPPSMDGDFALIRPVSFFKSLHAAAILDSINYPVIVNSWFPILVSGDKIITYSMMVKHGIPTPLTYYAFSSESFLKIVEKLGFPLISKPPYGSWGRLVSLIDSHVSAKIIAEHREELKSPLTRHHIVQEFVETGYFDIRCLTIFDEITGCIIRKASGKEWRSNVALGGRPEEINPDSELEDIVLKVAKIIGGGFLAIDVLVHPKRGYLVNEVNGVPEFKGFVKATGINVAEKLVKSILDKIRK